MTGDVPIDVLVVDDDVRVARINAAYVAKVPGFRVVATAHSTAGALAALDERPVDLILLDHHLPDENGLAAVRKLRARGHQCDVIMVTAARDVTTVRAAMRHGALQYLVKPFSFAGLRGKLEAYATLRRTLEGGGEAEQAEVDRIFGVLAAGSVAPDLPKGHSPTTAELVRQVLLAADGPLSAQRSPSGPASAARPPSATSNSWNGPAGCASRSGTARRAAPSTGTPG